MKEECVLLSQRQIDVLDDYFGLRAPRQLLFTDIENTEKQQEPEYTVHSMEFDQATRMARIVFCQSTRYRTIDKYVTRNYTRYPIYSQWKTKTKLIKKTIKLDNVALEELNVCDDELVSLLADRIVGKIGDASLYPSWYTKDYLSKQFEYDLDKLKMEVERKHDFNRDTTESLISDNNRLSLQITKEVKCQKRLNKKIVKLEKRLAHKEKSLATKVLKAIVTLGIYLIYYSVAIQNKRVVKVADLNSKLAVVNGQLVALDNEIQHNKNKIEELRQNDEQIEIDYERDLKKMQYELGKSFRKVVELPQITNMSEDDFISLKSFVGLPYEKIIGCYVIRNVENEKCYVGQSKDVMRRIRQHFSGTTPKNSIFCEDYYSTEPIERDRLFEISIIKCSTKDELDSTERNLIAVYDSWNCGYNGTSGNI